MNILKVKVREGDLYVNSWFITVDKIAEYYYDGTKTSIGLTTGNWIYVDGDKTQELTKLLTVSTGGKVMSME